MGKRSVVKSSAECHPPPLARPERRRDLALHATSPPPPSRMRLSFLAPLLLRGAPLSPAPPPRMQLFPTDELPEVPPRPVAGRGAQVADLLRSLIAQPEDTRRLLQDATPMLLVPFQPNARQEDDSIFTDGMDVAEKMEVYSEELEKRIAVAKAAETRVALRLMRDHVLQAAAQLRDNSGQPSEES